MITICTVEKDINGLILRRLSGHRTYEGTRRFHGNTIKSLLTTWREKQHKKILFTEFNVSIYVKELIPSEPQFIWIDSRGEFISIADKVQGFGSVGSFVMVITKV